MRDITAAGANRQLPPRLKDSVVSLSCDDTKNIEPRPKRRKVAEVSNIPEVNSPPLRRAICNSATQVNEDRGFEARDSDELTVKCEHLDDSQQDELQADFIDCTRSRDHTVNGLLGRELGMTRSSSTFGPHDWQSQTANFHTTPRDKHVCRNIVARRPPMALPFCTASCNRSSLVAIGDEEGGVRLLETELDDGRDFSSPYLTFIGHRNAILDLAFSPDDKLLATGSGDQAAHIIDMFSQQVTHELIGHSSSVKQVRFRPESSDIVATSSRDGSVQLWDLRCNAGNSAVMQIETPVEPQTEGLGTSTIHPRPALLAARVNAIFDAHSDKGSAQGESTPVTIQQRPRLSATELSSGSKKQPLRADGTSVTALAFPGNGLDHLLLTGGQANATVKLWDLRATHLTRLRSRHAVALSSTRLPKNHSTRRHWGLTSINMSSDGSRLYTVCKDKIVYAYSTSHLMLGHAPELSTRMSKSRRFGGPEKLGLGPLYGLRHPRLQVNTFYVKGAIRPASEDKTELLAVGSSDGCAVLFPTDERYLRPAMSIGGSIPVYEHGTALVRGHNQEVTDLTWTPGGELVTIGDDLTSRCWREGSKARELRLHGEGEGKRWESGWAEATKEWDEED